ncbi:armadillo-type protein [Zopfochytrium polystomum]|nr:armadillo-type protein [Zopfochytrium polystomum]
MATGMYDEKETDALFATPQSDGAGDESTSNGIDGDSLDAEDAAAEVHPTVPSAGGGGGSGKKRGGSAGLTLAEMSLLLLPQLPEGVDPTKMKLAYGRRAIPKLITEFPSGPLLHRQKSLVFLCDLLRNPENVAQALQERIVGLLVNCLKERDLCVKQKSTEAFAVLAGYSLGRAALVQENTLVPLSKLMDDGCDLVRKNLHTTLARVVTQQDGASNLLLYQLLVPLVKKVETERMDIQVLILDTIYQCTRLGSEPWIPAELVNCSAMEAFTRLIKKDPVTEVKVAAAKCVMMLSFHKIGKEIATKSDTITVLIALLSDRKSEVRAAAAGALMAITVDCDAKRTVVRENAVPTLMELLDDQNPNVLLNVIKTITNVAEDYRGRFQLHSSVAKLETFFTSNNAQLSQAAKTAVQVITWRP